MSVKILSTVKTSCTANPWQIEVTELKGYSWQTCSKQPRLVDCVVNKLDRRRRRRRVLLTTRSTCRGEIFQVRSWGQSSRGKYTIFWRYPNFLITLCVIGRKKPLCHCQKSARFVQLFWHNTGLWRTNGQTDRQTDGRTDGRMDTGRQQIPRQHSVTR